MLMDETRDLCFGYLSHFFEFSRTRAPWGDFNKTKAGLVYLLYTEVLGNEKQHQFLRFLLLVILGVDPYARNP
jgi:hypothetical protein